MGTIKGDALMKEIATTITQRGQITLPVEVQRLLGVRPKDKVAFEIDDGQVRLVPARYTLESAMGSVGPPTATEDFKRISREVREEQAERATAKLQDQQ
jgi:AbrB family looped-hinge helix DNA binding protein